MGAVKGFLADSAKIAVALLGVAILLILGAVGVSSWQTHRKDLKEGPLGTKKQWESQKLISPITVDVATAWREGQTHYQLSVSKYSEDTHRLEPSASITMEFSDQDGFKLWDKEIPWAEMAGISGKDGTGTEGFVWSGNTNTNADDYARAARVGIAWRGLEPKLAPLQRARVAPSPATKEAPPRADRVSDDPLPEPTAAPGWSVFANWRRLTFGQSPEAVKSFLGEPTNIMAYSSGFYAWRYGSGGGEVTFVGGRVSRWVEPTR